MNKKIILFFSILAIFAGCEKKSTTGANDSAKEYFDAYFKNCHTAYAIKIGEVVKLDTPIDPKEVIKNFHAPQNFMYVDIDL